MDPYRDALKRMDALLSRARRSGLREPMAAVLATADAAGRPSARTVLIKAVDDRGVTFYTNVKSRKASQLGDNPHAALCAYWDPLREQLIVEGKVELVSPEEADAYWATRPRVSQIGAWASRQSKPLPSRAALIGQVAVETAKYVGRPVPRPPHWSGYRLVPERIEFWSGRPFRLNERRLYVRRGKRWSVGLVYP
ncbi:MAG TPA: pyridoxamine 5'-phosphate oxidase [bacterium]